MPLPEYVTPEVERLQTILDDAGEEGFIKFPELNRDDLVNFGRYIQLYSYIEFNLRRCIEIFCRAGFLQSPTDYRRLPVAQLIPILKRAVSPEKFSDHEFVLLNFNEIEVRHGLRHMMAHWVVRKFPNDDAVVFITKDTREAEKIGHPVVPDYATTAIMLLPDIRGLLNHMNEVQKWLGQKTAEWHASLIGN